MDRSKGRAVAQDVEAVVTSYDQGDMVLEAVDSLCGQTLLPGRIVLVDDGSTEASSLAALDALAARADLPIPLTVIRQPNGGVSAARNAGLRQVRAPLALVLDGDDRVAETYIQQVYPLLQADPSMVAASSWMRTFGVLDALVQPRGGNVRSFLARNACPATHLLRRAAWAQCGGYDEGMRSGFEDWDFFLSLLETGPEARIGIVEAPLLAYRTAPASSNIQSMAKRLELMGYLIRKHHRSYQAHLEEALLALEAISMARLQGWEGEICQALQARHPLSPASAAFLHCPSYGDGGMAAAVRVASRYAPDPAQAR